jgi:hypothetical protein
MNNNEKDLELLHSTKEIVCKAMGLALSDDVIKKVLDGEPISLDQLTNEYTATEIGIALIRLDTFPKSTDISSSFSGSTDASSSFSESTGGLSSTPGLRLHVGNWWWNLRTPS